MYWPQNTQLLTILLYAVVGQICCKNDWGQDFYLLPNDVPTTCRHLTRGIVAVQLSCINQQPCHVSRAATHSLQRQRVLIRSCRAEARSARAECIVEVVRCAVCYIFVGVKVALGCTRAGLAWLQGLSILPLFHVPCVDECMGASCHVWPSLADWVLRCCTELFHAFSLDNFSGCIAHKTGRLFQPIVQGSSLCSIMGQETCELVRIV